MTTERQQVHELFDAFVDKIARDVITGATDNRVKPQHQDRVFDVLIERFPELRLYIAGCILESNEESYDRVAGMDLFNGLREDTGEGQEFWEKYENLIGGAMDEPDMADTRYPEDIHYHGKSIEWYDLVIRLLYEELLVIDLNDADKQIHQNLLIDPGTYVGYQYRFEVALKLCSKIFGYEEMDRIHGWLANEPDPFAVAKS